MKMLLLLVVIVAGTACGPAPNANSPNVTTNKNTRPKPTPSGPAPVYTYDIVKTYPHDPNAFTEGLYYKDGFLYESTGENDLSKSQNDQSSLRKVELDTGKVVQRWNLPPKDFGEGISELNGKIYQLTWQLEMGRVFDPNDFKLLQEFNYQGEGWGMTTDGTNLILDQGTPVLKWMDPNTFATVKTLPVTREDGQPQKQINELELIKGELWANIWHSEDPEILGKNNYIARIDPNTGRIIGWIDLGGISPDDVSRNPENTLNGIAYDAANDRIFVTGKRWKNLFEIKVKPKAQ